MFVNRDYAINGLANKAVATHRSIGILAQNGLGSDAFSLSRVLLENAMILRWLQQDSTGFRIDAYCAVGDVFKANWANVIKTHYTHREDMLEAAEKFEADGAAAALIEQLGKLHTKWARAEKLDKRDPKLTKLQPLSLREIFLELGVPDENGEMVSFMYDGPYFELSAYIHSTISSPI